MILSFCPRLSLCLSVFSRPPLLDTPFPLKDEILILHNSYGGDLNPYPPTSDPPDRQTNTLTGDPQRAKHKNTQKQSCLLNCREI